MPFPLPPPPNWVIYRKFYYKTGSHELEKTKVEKLSLEDLE